MGARADIYRGLKTVARKLAEPLKADNSVKKFTLSIPEAQTTTVDSVQGKAMRPPTVVRCDGCTGEIVQHNALDRLDCSGCHRTYEPDDLGSLDLVAMICPRCESIMDSGIRHKQLFDTPEWATCPQCQYHWDLDHWF